MTEGTATPESPAWEGQPSYEDLEQRVQRLEDAVAALCDTQALEERLATRVTEHIAKKTQLAPSPPPVAALAPHQTDEDSPYRGGVAQSVFSTMTSPDTFSLLGEMWWDIKSFWSMLRDPLYPMTWLARLIVLLPIAYVLWSTFAGFHNGVLGAIGYVIDLVLLCPFLYFPFKIWGRELRRYREFLAMRRHR